MQKPLFAALAWCIPIVSASAEETSHVTADSVRAFARKELKTGANLGEAEAFLKRHKFEYSYDEFSNRYQGLVRISKYHAIVIYIYHDKARRFTKADVQDSYTGL